MAFFILFILKPVNANEVSVLTGVIGGKGIFFWAALRAEEGTTTSQPVPMRVEHRLEKRRIWMLWEREQLLSRQSNYGKYWKIQIVTYVVLFVFWHTDKLVISMCGKTVESQGIKHLAHCVCCHKHCLILLNDPTALLVFNSIRPPISLYVWIREPNVQGWRQSVEKTEMSLGRIFKNKPGL